MKWIILLVPILVWLLHHGHIQSHVVKALAEVKDQLVKRQLGGLDKRGFHEESPSYYVSDDSILEFYYLLPYYPSRM